MQPLTEAEIRSAFINCSKGEAKRASLPDLPSVPWDELDFFGWQDPSGSDRCYLMVPLAGELIGLLMRRNTGPKQPRRNLCTVCLTSHTSEGVRLLVAPRAGESGRKGNTVGLYLCTDFGCSLYIRGKRPAPYPRFQESLSVEEQAARAMDNVRAFVTRVRRA